MRCNEKKFVKKLTECNPYICYLSLPSVKNTPKFNHERSWHEYFRGNSDNERFLLTKKKEISFTINSVTHSMHSMKLTELIKVLRVFCVKCVIDILIYIQLSFSLHFLPQRLLLVKKSQSIQTDKKSEHGNHQRYIIAWIPDEVVISFLWRQ